MSKRAWEIPMDYNYRGYSIDRRYFPSYQVIIVRGKARLWAGKDQVEANPIYASVIKSLTAKSFHQRDSDGHAILTSCTK
jgi:hypothetical protein